MKYGQVKSIEDLEKGQLVTLDNAKLPFPAIDHPANQKNLDIIYQFRNHPMQVVSAKGRYVRVRIPMTEKNEDGTYERVNQNHLVKFAEFEWMYLPDGMFPELENDTVEKKAKVLADKNKEELLYAVLSHLPVIEQFSAGEDLVQAAVDVIRFSVQQILVDDYGATLEKEQEAWPEE